ncbi:MAG: MarR family transcriptional regulator [Proteobacteria bacterium]|nr:MarR family transcriptional regulator [Pseudomonadota bacterium]
MTEITAKNVDSQDFIPLVRELLNAYHAFASFDANGHRLSGSDLTVAQANVIFTLGNTDGMTCKDIGDWTHITKGTLTGVIDRLENKGLVERWAVEGDGRKTIIALTRQGDRVFKKEFPRHLSYLKERFDQLGARDRDQAVRLLQKIQQIFM